jgi:hypothetical protein
LGTNPARGEQAIIAYICANIDEYIAVLEDRFNCSRYIRLPNAKMENPRLDEFVGVAFYSRTEIGARVETPATLLQEEVVASGQESTFQWRLPERRKDAAIE